jgi:hypothetical protein
VIDRNTGQLITSGTVPIYDENGNLVATADLASGGGVYLPPGRYRAVGPDGASTWFTVGSTPFTETLYVGEPGLGSSAANAPAAAGAAPGSAGAAPGSAGAAGTVGAGPAAVGAAGVEPGSAGAAVQADQPVPGVVRVLDRVSGQPTTSGLVAVYNQDGTLAATTDLADGGALSLLPGLYKAVAEDGTAQWFEVKPGEPFTVVTLVGAAETELAGRNTADRVEITSLPSGAQQHA